MNEAEGIAVFRERLKDVACLAEHSNKAPVLIVQQFPVKDAVAMQVPYVRESISNVLAFVELSTESALKAVLEEAEPVFTYFIMDADRKRSNSDELIGIAKTKLKDKPLFFYHDNHTWAESAIQLLQILLGDLQGKRVWLKGHGGLFDALSWKLDAWNVVWESEDSEPRACDVIIGGSIRERLFDRFDAVRMQSGSVLLDVGIGNFSPDVIQAAMGVGCKLYRVDVRGGLSAMVLGLLETHDLVTQVMGKTKINDVEMVAGGEMGSDGAIVLDHIRKPGAIIGIADGGGQIREPGEKDENALSFVKRLLNQDDGN